MRTIGAAKCKAHFLALVDEVEAKREPILVTKKGRPVAKVVPLDVAEKVDPLARYIYPGVVTVLGDIISPTHTDAEWEAFSDASAAQFNGTD